MSNIYEKITVIRDELNNLNLKKSGENKFAKYKYYELSDFLPSLISLMKEHKVFSAIRFGKSVATLKLINTENPEEVVIFTCPVVDADLKGCTKIQALGATQTYIRRYLYTVAFDISENDIVDSTEQKEKQSGAGDAGNAKKQASDIISTGQAKRLFALGKGQEDTIRNIINAKGYKSTKDIKKTDYEQICKDVEVAVSHFNEHDVPNN